MSNSIFDSVISKDLTEISADILEVEIDQLIKNEFLKDIPILGIGIKAYGITQKIAESFFIKKLLRSLFELKDIPQNKREDFIAALENEKDNQKAGETLLVIVNKLDDVSKASIIGKLFRATIQAKISVSDFLRLSHIVDKVYIDDLKTLKHNYESLDEDIKSILFQAGLLKQEYKDNSEFDGYVKENTGSNSKIPNTMDYSLNRYALLLIKLGL